MRAPQPDSSRHSELSILQTRPSPRLPLPIEIIARIATIYLAVFKNFTAWSTRNMFPIAGPLILVSNHTAVYDPLGPSSGMQASLDSVLEAREYYNGVGLGKRFTGCSG
jgi:hypothetical protein